VLLAFQVQCFQLFLLLWRALFSAEGEKVDKLQGKVLHCCLFSVASKKLVKAPHCEVGFVMPQTTTVHTRTSFEGCLVVGKLTRLLTHQSQRSCVGEASERTTSNSKDAHPEDDACQEYTRGYLAMAPAVIRHPQFQLDSPAPEKRHLLFPKSLFGVRAAPPPKARGGARALRRM